MIILTDKILLFLYCLGTCAFFAPNPVYAAFSLAAAGISAFNYSLHSEKFCGVALLLYGCAAGFFPTGLCFFPLLTYDLMCLFKGRRERLCLFLPPGILACVLAQDFPAGCLYYLAFGTALCVVLYLRTDNLLKLQETYRKVRDDSMERNLLLQEKNRTLLEKQNYEIYAATLKERNRIAREIHDHVGHMLSRSILMVGALKAISKEPALSLPLDQLNDTLNTAMNNIRESVHDLHDESLNLKEAVDSLLKDFTYCPVSLEYDMGFPLPSSVKYCFLAVIKEALSNLAKHSQATAAHITLREHPALYQLIFSDNGKGMRKKETGDGIGLLNMKERVSLLGGTIRFQTEKGFCIFLTIPKTDDGKGELPL